MPTPDMLEHWDPALLPDPGGTAAAVTPRVPLFEGLSAVAVLAALLRRQKSQRVQKQAVFRSTRARLRRLQLDPADLGPPTQRLRGRQHFPVTRVPGRVSAAAAAGGEGKGKGEGVKESPWGCSSLSSTAATAVDTAGMKMLGSGCHAPVFRGGYRRLFDVTVKLAQFDTPEPFYTEVKALEMASGHPNIVQLLGVHMAPPCDMVIVYEYAAGVPLHTLCRDFAYAQTKREMALAAGDRVEQAAEPGELGVPLALQLDVARSLANAMRHCHARRVFHRDLKTTNIVVEVRPETYELRGLKLIDFGIAKIMRRSVREEREDSLGDGAADENWWELWADPRGVPDESAGSSLMTKGVGTFDWVAPEVWGGPDARKAKRVSYGYPADVYAYAIVLYELVTCRLPWSTEYVTEGHGSALYHETLKNDIACGHRPVLPADVHPFMAKLIRACWDNDPAARPTFAEVLGRLAKDAPWEEARAALKARVVAEKLERQRRARVAVEAQEAAAAAADDSERMPVTLRRVANAVRGAASM